MRLTNRIGRVVGTGFVAAVLSLLSLSPPAHSAVRDVRDEIARHSRRRLEKEVRTRGLPPKHHWRPPESVVAKTTAPPVPGGTGFGYYFYNTSLLWSNSTVMDYYIVTPSTIGGFSQNWLYLTTTCRSQLGTEALIGFDAQAEASFMVFDWARAATAPWQVEIELPSFYPEYLTTRWDEFGNRRQMCHVRNGTFYMGFGGGSYNWRNQVLLFNFALGDWDVVYSYDYTTTTLGANLFQSGGGGWWGPIVETFGTYTNTHALGFELVRLYQDGRPNPIWLGSSNCYFSGTSDFHPITVAPNRSFTVYSGLASPDSAAFEIQEISSGALGTTALLRVNSLPARQYRAYNGVFVGRSWEWFPIGQPLAGTGDSISFEVPARLQAGLFRVSATYNTSSLTVVSDNPHASFSLSPSVGVVASPWVSESISNRWDKIVVGIPPGSYTISFTAPAGFTTPPPQSFTLASNNIASVFAIFGPGQQPAAGNSPRAAKIITTH